MYIIINANIKNEFNEINRFLLNYLHIFGVRNAISDVSKFFLLL